MKKKEMNYITLYADEHDTDAWKDYCRAAGVPTSATEITLWFKEEDVEYEDGDEENNDDDHKTIEENACDCIALTEYEGGEPVHYTKSDKELQEWLDADEEHSWFPVDDNPEDDEEEEEENPLVSYDVDDNGVLHIYLDDYILADIQHCGKMSDKKIENLVEEVLEEHGWKWNEDGTATSIDDEEEQ